MEKMTQKTLDYLNTEGEQKYEFSDYENLVKSAIKFDLTNDLTLGTLLHEVDNKKIVSVLSPDEELILKIGEVGGENTYESIVVNHCYQNSQEPLEDLYYLNPNFVKEAFKLRLENKNEILDNPETSVEILEVLSEDEDWWTRERLAGHPNLSTELMEKLANDEYVDIRCMLAKRDDLPSSLVEKLANDEHWFVKVYIAEREDLSDELIERLSNDTNSFVKHKIKHHSRLTQESKPKDLVM